MNENKLSIQRHLTINRQTELDLKNRQNLILKRQNTIKKLERLYTLEIKRPQTQQNSSSKIKQRTIIKLNVERKETNSHNQKTPFITETTKDSISIRKDLNEEKNKTINNNNTINNNTINNIKHNSNDFVPLRKSTTLSDSVYNYIHKKNLKSINLKKNIVKQETLNPKRYLRKDMTLKEINQIIHGRKPKNPLEISEEDKIFNQFNKVNNNNDNINNNNSNNTKNENKKNHIKNIKSENLTIEQKLFINVYKLTPDFYEKVFKAKKQKRKLNLENYQNNLLKTINNTFSPKSVRQLEKKFVKIRDDCKIDLDNNCEFIKGLEKTEKKIVKNINKINKTCVKVMRTTGVDFGFGSFKLPKVKFYRTIKTKKKNSNFFLNNSDSQS